MPRDKVKPKKKVTGVRIGSIAPTQHMSTAAKCKVLQDVKEHGMPTAVSVSTATREKKAFVNRSTSMGPTIIDLKLPLEAGGEVTIPFQNPFPMLLIAMQLSPEFENLFARILTFSNNCLDVIMYNDDITPGQALKKNNWRKTVAVYWSFANFGMYLLSNDKLWFTLCTIRTSLASAIAGSLSCIYKHGLRLFFGRPSGIDARDGVVMQVAGQSCLWFAKFFMSLADHLAHKLTLNCTGSSGTICCFFCKNIFALRSRRLPDPTGFALPCCELSFANFKLHTGASIRGALVRLQQVSDAGDEPLLTRLQEEFGWNHVPESWLLDPHLSIDVAETSALDWMHCMVEGGAYDSEVEHVSTELEPLGYGATAMNQYFGLWNWPGGYASAKRVFESGKYVASASENLSSALVLNEYLRNVGAKVGVMAAEIISMQKACVLLLLFSIVATGLVSWEMLEAAVVDFLTCHYAAYETLLWKPKHHYLMHMADQLRRMLILLATFVHERKHRLIKAAAQLRSNTGSFERGVLEDVTRNQLHDLMRPFSTDLRLSHPITAPNTVRSQLIEHGVVDGSIAVMSSTRLIVNSRAVCRGDVALYRIPECGVRVGKVVTHIEAGGVHWTELEQWDILNGDGLVLVCKVGQKVEYVQSQNVIESCIYATAGIGQRSRVLLPYRAHLDPAYAI